MPRWVDARRVTFKYGLGDEFIDVLEVLHKLGLDRTAEGARRRRRGVAARRRRRVPARPGRRSATGCRQDLRRHLGDRHGQGRQPARGVPVPRGRQRHGRWPSTASQAVVWQTAINPVVALELLAEGTWSGAGVLGPEALAPKPFLDMLVEYGSPWGIQER